MSLPKDESIPLSIGGQHFAVKRSVLTAEPDSMLGAMFSGEWNQANGDTDESGVRKLKGVRPELFKLLLEHYLEPRALEHAYELDAKPHPMVRGPRAEEYRRMLRYLGLDRAAEETHGTHDKFDTALVAEEINAANVSDDRRTFSPWFSPVPAGTTLYMLSLGHAVGTPAELRVHLKMTDGVCEQQGDDPLLLFLGVRSLPKTVPDTHAAWASPGNQGGSSLLKSEAQLQAIFGRNIFEDSIIRLSVTADSCVWLAVEGAGPAHEGGEERCALGKATTLQEGTYRFCVGLDRPGIRATILPPAGTAILTV